MTINLYKLRFPDQFIAYVLHGGNGDVNGWVEPGALTLTALLSQTQVENGVTGSTAEIGVHHGRFFIVLCLLRNLGESAIAIDIFEDQNLNLDLSGRGSRKKLLRNIKRHVGSLEGISLLKADSLTVQPDTILEQLGGPARLFSVDGCHTREHTESDIRLASQVLAPGGIVVVDDIFNPAWPGVMAGVEAFLQSDNTHPLVPLVAADNKLILCQLEWREKYGAAIREHLLPVQGGTSSIPLFGTEIINQSFPPLDLLLDSGSHARAFGQHMLQAIRFSSQSHAAYHFGPGWSSPELWGTWTDGTDAQLTVMTKASEGMEVVLQVVAHAFVHRAHPRLSVDVKVNGFDAGCWAFRASNEPREMNLTVPEAWNRSSEIVLDFHIREPRSPIELGLSKDDRKLGIGLRTLKVLQGVPIDIPAKRRLPFGRLVEIMRNLIAA
jgi:hypothetical protein